MGTGEPTYIDYSFAALAAIVALPDQYGGPRLTPASRLKFSTFQQKFKNTSKSLERLHLESLS